MPEPTAPTPSSDDRPDVTPEDLLPKPRERSGFDPKDYEEAMAAREEATRMRELPPRVRMYSDFLNQIQRIVNNTIIEIEEGTISIDTIEDLVRREQYEELSSNLKTNVRGFYANILNSGGSFLLETHLSCPHDLQKYISAVEIDLIYCFIGDSEDTPRPLGGQDIIIECQFFDNESDHIISNADAKDLGFDSINEYAIYYIVLSPENLPLMVQHRFESNDSLQDRIEQGPVYHLTDGDAQALIEALKETERIK